MTRGGRSFLPWLLTAAIVAPHTAALSQSAGVGRTGENRLVSQARQQPDSVRDAISRSLGAVVSAATEVERHAGLVRAQQMAYAYSVAWSDSFFIRQVSLFTSWPSRARREHVISDSLRREGNAAMVSAGVPAAMQVWRRSLLRATSINDSTAIAPVLVSIGAGFYRLGQFDSAEIYVRRGERYAARIGDRRTAGNAIGILASVQKDRGETAAAEASYRRSSLIRAQSGDTRGMAADENNLGLIAESRGDYALAREAYERALALNRRDKRAALVALNLSNLAGIATSVGDYPRAESLYREALALHGKTGDRAEAAFAEHGLGKLFISRGDYRQAKTYLDRALRNHEASGAALEAVSVKIDLAAVQRAMGDPENARVLLQQAAQSANANRAPAETQGSLALGRGDLAIEFGTLGDADVEYTRALRFYLEAKDSSGVAQALQSKALLLHWRGDDAGSLSLLNKASRLQKAGGHVRSAAITSLIVGDVQADAGRFTESRNTLVGARTAFRGFGDAVGEASAFASLGDLLLRTGSFRPADSTYVSGLKKLGSLEATQARLRLHTGRGKALRRAGSLASAAAELRVAIASVEKTASTLRLEERRSGYLADKWEAYTELALVEQARGRAAEAFAVSEQMRARQMLDMLARGRVGRRSAESVQEQDLRRRIAILTRQLEARDVRDRELREPALDARSTAKTRADLDRAQTEYARLLSRIREVDPGYAILVSAKTRSWKDVASRLKQDEIFLEYLLTDSACTVFVITSDTVAAIDLRTTHQSLADLVEFSRKTVDARTSQGAAERSLIPLRRLYTTLIQPVAGKGFLRGKRTLLIAPHGELHFLSFAALVPPPGQGRYLVDRFDIAYTPSATVWVELGHRRFPPSGERVLALAPNVSRLPASLKEANAIGRIYGKAAIVKLGASATPRALRDALSNVRVVHLATFGVLNRHNPLFSFVELAPSGQDDGRLEVNEVFGLSLTGQLVILSACQTALASGALADVPPGDDWVGLLQAFLQAGAGGVVASLWPVEDRATGELMVRFHERLARGMSPVSALADAQRTLIKNSATDRPLYWAGFTISGRLQ